MQFDKPVLLYGAGREGRSTLAYLKRVAPETPIFVTTDDGDPKLEGAEYIAVESLPEAIAAGKFGLIVKSPGISLYKPIFDVAREAGLPISSNLNLWAEAYRESRTVIAITGTKGKSTTATLTHLAIQEAGLNVGLAGNIGVPPLDAADKYDIVVLELSSYQTADMNFAPDYAAITNLYPEHIDWHGTIDRYYQDKLNLIRQPGDFPIILGSQAASHSLVNSTIKTYKRIYPPLLESCTAGLEKTVEASRLKGPHNYDNACIAARLAMAVGGTSEAVHSGIASFSLLPHRLEEHQNNGITFVDDSIATTPEATIAALSAYPDQRIALIAGGYERQQNWGKLVDHLEQGAVAVLVCLPDTGDRLALEAREAVPDLEIIEAKTLQDGMQALATRRDKFDNVILSPGAPSYNQFANFEERGDEFIRLAKGLFG